jgi:uncharacterized protein YjbI with pentapeptide repeats
LAFLRWAALLNGIAFLFHAAGGFGSVLNRAVLNRAVLDGIVLQRAVLNGSVLDGAVLAGRLGVNLVPHQLIEAVEGADIANQRQQDRDQGDRQNGSVLHVFDSLRVETRRGKRRMDDSASATSHLVASRRGMRLEKPDDNNGPG